MSADEEDIAGIHYELRRVADALESLPGVELRDLFAAVALHSGINAPPPRSGMVFETLRTEVAEQAYRWADSMLKARGQ